MGNVVHLSFEWHGPSFGGTVWSASGSVWSGSEWDSMVRLRVGHDGPSLVGQYGPSLGGQYGPPPLCQYGLTVWFVYMIRPSLGQCGLLVGSAFMVRSGQFCVSMVRLYGPDHALTTGSVRSVCMVRLHWVSV